jgi:hypothetical protein
MISWNDYKTTDCGDEPAAKFIGAEYGIETATVIRGEPSLHIPPENTALIGFVLYFADHHPSALPNLQDSAPLLILQ